MTRLLLAAVSPFAAGAVFSLLTEPALSERSSAGIFADGIREACAAPSVLATNGRAAIVLMSGIVTGGITSVIGLASLGRDLATVCVKASLQGTPLSQIAAGILPHGVLELPALLAAGAAGLAGAPLLWSFARGDRDRLTATIALSLCLTASSLTLLVPAAIIECHVTPAILRWTL